MFKQKVSSWLRCFSCLRKGVFLWLKKGVCGWENISFRGEETKHGLKSELCASENATFS